MHDTHRKPGEQYELAAKPTVLPPNTMKKGRTKRETGIRNERWSTPIALTSLRRMPTTSQGR
jgi:hypothetical protein